MSTHQVPIHLNQPDGIGPFSFRQVFLGAGALFYVAPLAWGAAPVGGPAGGDLLRVMYPGLGWLFQPGSIPMIPLVFATTAIAPFFALALPLDPPVEHGAISAVGWIREHGYMKTERMKELLGRPTVKADRIETDYGIGAVWEMPSMNLRLADASTIEVAQDLWGEFVNGLTSPVMTMTASTRTDAERLVGKIASYKPSPFLPNGGTRTVARGGSGSGATNKDSALVEAARGPQDNARRVAEWLRENARNHLLIERRHFLVVHAEDEQAFADIEQEISDGIGSLGFRNEQIRRLEGEELRSVINRTWSPHAPSTKGVLGPKDKPFVASNAIWLDGEWHMVLAFGKWPRVLRDNALAALNDGVYDVDVIEHITPIEADSILDGLERRADAMKVSGGRKRQSAVQDLEKFIEVLRDGTEAPFDVAVLLHAHAPTKKQVEIDAKRIVKRVRRGHLMRKATLSVVRFLDVDGRCGAMGRNHRQPKASWLESVAATVDRQSAHGVLHDQWWRKRLWLEGVVEPRIVRRANARVLWL
jgi:hypothetical protein